MAIDAGIYQNFLRPVKSIQDFDNEAMAAQGNALQLQQQKMQMNALQQQQQDDQSLRNYLAGGANLSTPEGAAGLYRVAPKAAGGILKSQAEIAQANAATKKDQEQGSKAAQEKIGEAIKNSRIGLEGVTTPEQYLAWHVQNHADPVLGAYLDSRGVTVDSARAQIEDALKKPGGFEQLINESKMGAEKTYAQVMRQKEFDLKASNELIGPDGKINQTLLGAKKQVAQAGAPVQSSVTYQVDGQGNLVALPTKIPNGSGSVSSVPVMSGGQPVQGVGKDKPLPEAAQKQVMGARNLQDAVGGYLSKLDGWSNAKMLSPDQRAEMGNAYNNMMLQAKEAYNLGVLNGPDYDILQSVVKDPTKLTSILTSNEALSGQAKSLRSIAANIEKTALESHGKKYTPRDQSASAGPKPGGGVPDDIAAILDKHLGKGK